MTNEAAQEAVDALAEKLAQPDMPDMPTDMQVNLSVVVPEAASPQDAVEQALWGFITNGMDNYIYTVHDRNSDAVWIVQEGELLTPDEMQKILEEQTGGGN